MHIALKGIYSSELHAPELPSDPTCCAVLMSADIGEHGTPGSDRFNFHLVTPAFLMQHPETRWGHGYLLMPEFSWAEIEHRLEHLVATASAESWEAATQKLCRYLTWEYDDYQHKKNG